MIEVEFCATCECFHAVGECMKEKPSCALFIREGKMWEKDGKWERKCPECGGVCVLNDKYHCFKACKNKVSCRPCAFKKRPLPTEATKKLWSEQRKGPKNHNYGKKGQLSWHYGRKRSEQACKNISNAWNDEMKKKVSLRSVGSKNVMFGKTHTPEVKKFLVQKNAEYWNSNDGIEMRKRFSGLKLGVPLSEEHKLHVWQASEKSSYKLKDYVFPNGRTEKVQGYENLTLDYLVNVLSINSDDILVRRGLVPKIHYNYNGVVSRYYPDCYVVSLNLIVETKSGWIWKKWEDKNKTKVVECVKQGFNVAVILWDGKKKMECYKIFKANDSIQFADVGI